MHEGLLSACAVAALAILAACSSSTAGAGGLTQVVASDDSCKPAKTSFQSGKQSFEIENDGKGITALSVFGENDRVVGQVGNVGPDESRKLSVTLKPGHYELACTPGQTGRGIRVPITVS
jgi:iron uptake system component EfeO